MHSSDSEKRVDVWYLEPGQFCSWRAGGIVAPLGQEQGHKNVEDHEHCGGHEQRHGPREDDGQEEAYGHEQSKVISTDWVMV